MLSTESTDIRSYAYTKKVVQINTVHKAAIHYFPGAAIALYTITIAHSVYGLCFVVLAFAPCCCYIVEAAAAAPASLNIQKFDVSFKQTNK